MPKAATDRVMTRVPGEPPSGHDATRQLALPDRVGFHLRLAQEASFRAFARRVGMDDLKPRWFSILSIIAAEPGINQTALSRAAGRDKSSLTPSVFEMERRGLVARERAPNDRRVYTLHLTPEGHDLLARLTEHANAHDRDLERIIGPARQKTFIEGLVAITREFGDEDERGS